MLFQLLAVWPSLQQLMVDWQALEFEGRVLAAKTMDAAEALALALTRV